MAICAIFESGITKRLQVMSRDSSFSTHISLLLAQTAAASFMYLFVTEIAGIGPAEEHVIPEAGV